MPYTQITPELRKELQARILDAVKDIVQEYHLSARLHTSSYDQTRMLGSLVIESLTEQHVPARLPADYLGIAANPTFQWRWSGFTMPQPDWLNRVVSYRGREHRLVGFNTRSRRLPIVLQRLDTGKLVNIALQELAALMGE